MKSIAAIGFMAVVSVGCVWQPSPMHHYELDIEPGFSAKQIGEIITAANKWTDATDGMITFGLVGYSGGPATIDIHGMPLEDLRAKYNDPQVGGETEYTGGENTHIDLADDIDDASFMSIAEHELGHALGLQHSEKGTVMYYIASGDITCVDVVHLCDIWHCNPAEMRICQ